MPYLFQPVQVRVIYRLRSIFPALDGYFRPTRTMRVLGAFAAQMAGSHAARCDKGEFQGSSRL